MILPEYKLDEEIVSKISKEFMREGMGCPMKIKTENISAIF